MGMGIGMTVVERAFATGKKASTGVLVSKEELQGACTLDR